MPVTNGNNQSGGGRFVIGGMSFPNGGVRPGSWSSGQVAAVASVVISVGPGVTVTVDVADPSKVLAVSIEETGEKDRLVAACDAPDAASAIVDSVRKREPIEPVELSLRPEWARKALVAGITRWLPRPIHEGALLLDLAAAHQAVGERVEAARLVALAAPVLEVLAADSAEGFLSAAAAAELSDVAKLAADSVADLGWGDQIRGYADDIGSDVGFSDMDLIAVVERWNEVESLCLAAGMGTVDPRADIDRSQDVILDPALVTPRIIEWVDARHGEVHVAASYGDEVSVEFTVEISKFVDNRCYEVGRVAAFAADGAGGSLLRTATMTVDDRTLRAHFRFRRPDSGKVVYGIFDVDKGITAIRARAADQDSIAIDRLLLDAWSTHRAALAVHALTSELDAGLAASARGSAEALLDSANSLIAGARAKLKQLQLRLSRDDPSAAAAVAARLSAVDVYRAELVEQGLIARQGCRLLVCELLPLTSEVDPHDPT